MYQIIKEIGMPDRLYHKLWRIMRLTTVLLIACLMHVSASGLAQRITLNQRNVPLSTVLAEIRKQSGYDLYADAKILPKNHKITVSLSNVSVEEALNAALKGLNLVHKIEGNTIAVLQKAAPSLLDRVIAQFQSIHVTGRIVNSNGEGIIGVTVSVKGKSKSVIAGYDGNFMLEADEKDVLVLSYVGYKTKEVPVREKMGNILLEALVSPLDEVHVIGYGTESRRLSIGAVNTVSAKDIENQPVMNPLLALQGLVPGLNINSTSGAPGAAVRVQVRGQNSLSQNSNTTLKPYDQPLFIVDGVPVAAQNANINSLASLGGYDGTINGIGGFSPINSLNPADIESITVLKDVSSTAIYGTQGANGVILITTKKGRAGKTRVQANFNSGLNTATRKIKLLNTEQYLAYRREALANDGIDLSTAAPLSYPDLLVFDQQKNTDWFEHYLGGTSNNNDGHVSISGGADRMNFLISTGYTSSEYNIPGDFRDRRLTLHSNLNYTSLNDRLTVGFGFDFSHEKNNTAASANILNTILAPPNFPDLLDTSGNPVWNYKGYNTGSFAQYAANLKQPSAMAVHNMNTSLSLGYQIIRWLKFNVNLGYNRLMSAEDQRKPASTINPSNFPVSKATFTDNTFETINVEPQLNYQQNFGRGVFTGLLGATYKQNNITKIQLEGTNYANEALLGSIAQAGTILGTDSYNPYKYVGVFARLGYIYDQRYIIQLSGRRDGSSNFGPGRQFGNFGSVGLGWIFSEEQLFRGSSQLLSYGKLSASYGTVGTDSTLPYGYQQSFSGNTQPNFQGIKPLFIQNLYNPDYGWDTKKSWNLGLDLGFFKDKVLLNANYYRDRIGNQLVNYTLPSQTGFGSVLANFPAEVENKGLEINLTSKNVNGKNFSWTTNFNISANRNKLISFPGLEQSSYALRYSIGESVNIVRGYRLAGVNPETGTFEFYKTDGTLTSSPTYGIPSQGGDFQTIANLDPKYIGGLGNTLSYKRLSLYFLFQFQHKQQENYLSSIYSTTTPGSLSNQPVEILDHWRKPGDISSIQKLTTGFSFFGYNFITSSGAYSDGSYARLRTAALSYMLPSGFCEKLGISDAKVYLNGQNLFLITNYKVGDPELGKLFSFPIQRTMNFGLTINL